MVAPQAGFRPPPPPGALPPPAMGMNPLMFAHPEWYDVYDRRIYGPDLSAHDVNVVTFIVRHHVVLQRIVVEGGGKLLCELWDAEVADCRRSIRQAFEHLLKTDLVFCETHDVEFHVWKICFYHIVEALKVYRSSGKADQLQQPAAAAVDHDAAVKQNMLKLLDEGLDFYAQMLDTLEQTYKLDLEAFYDVLEARPTEDKASRSNSDRPLRSIFVPAVTVTNLPLTADYRQLPL